MWAPSVGLATVAPGRRGDRACPARRPSGAVICRFEPTALPYRGAPARRPGGPVASGPGIRRPGRPAGEAAGGLAVLDLLDHLAAELAADQLHPGQVLPPGGGWASVIRPLLVGGGGGLRPWRHRAGGCGAGLLAAGRRRAAGI